MPHFSSCCPGADTYICQKCGKIFCSKCQSSQWRPDITGHESVGNICPNCLKNFYEGHQEVTLFDWCKQESGLTDVNQINQYINRYYGHG